jgi:hypothetical protein
VQCVLENIQAAVTFRKKEVSNWKIKILIHRKFSKEELKNEILLFLFKDVILAPMKLYASNEME